MTATLNDVVKKEADEQSAEQRAAVELVRVAREQGLSLTGPDGLKQLTKAVLETALNEEMTEDLGYEKRDPPARVRVRATSVTAPGRRRSSPRTLDRSRSRSHETGPACSSRRSCASGSDA